MRRELEKLRKRYDLYFFVKEAVAIRGIPDIIGCINGRFFAWELKRSIKEVYRKDGSFKMEGRTVLQHYNIEKIILSGGVGRFVYPENLLECLKELTHSTQIQ